MRTGASSLSNLTLPLGVSRKKIFFFLSGAVIAIAMFLPSIASAADIGLFNTGVNNSGLAVPDDTIGDVHFTLISGPLNPLPDERIRRDGTFGGVGGYPIPPWLPDLTDPGQTTPVSAWIGPSTNHELIAPNGYYVYQYQFTLAPGFDPATASIVGRWAVDDGGNSGGPPADDQIFLNGISVVLGAPNGYVDWTDFQIPIGSPFQAGLNTVLFQTHNTGTFASGLRVEWTGTVVPEPGVAALLLTGLGASIIFARRRRK